MAEEAGSGMKEGGEEGWEDLDAQLGMTADLAREAEAQHAANAC